jgi:branched-chain amino acid transport system substrate-binding protein
MSDNDARSRRVRRRRFIQAAGAAGVLGLAGCTTESGDGGDGGSDGGDGGDGGGNETGSDGGSTGGGEGSIVIGQPSLLSGSLSFIQPPVSASADLAIQKINEAGGPLGREVEVVRRDTGRDPSQARETLRQFVNVDGAATVNGFTSTVVVPLWDFIQETEVPIVSMYSGTRFLDSRGGDGGTPEDISDDEWFWRTTGADSQHTAAAAVHAAREGATTIGAINEKSAGSRTWAQAFLDGARALDGVEVADRLEIDAGQSSYRADLEEFFSADVDLWGLATGVPSAVTLLQQWDQGGYGGRVMLSNPLQNPEIINQVGSQFEDQWVRTSVPAIAGPWADQYNSEFRSFVESSSDYESDLATNNWSASSYDAFTISALAIHAAGSTDPEAIQRQIGQVARPPGTEVNTFAEGKEALDNGDEINFQGAQTTGDFNEFGDVFNLAKIFQIGADGWQEVDQVQPDRIQEVISQVRQLSDN